MISASLATSASCATKLPNIGISLMLKFTQNQFILGTVEKVAEIFI